MTTNLFGKLLDLLGSHSGGEASAAQQEREALVDLMVWTMFVDRHVARAEQGFINERAGNLPWEGAYSLEVFVDASIRRIRDTLGSETAEEAYLEDIQGRLGSPEACRRACDACADLAKVDGDLAPAEAAHLERIHGRLCG